MNRHIRRAHRRQRRSRWPQPPAPQPPMSTDAPPRIRSCRTSHLIPADCLKYLDFPELLDTLTDEDECLLDEP